VRCPVVVGRAAELQILLDALARARGGHGAWINVTGEAGIGKTRLATAFVDACAAQGALVLTGRCSIVDRSTTYRPIAEALLGIAARMPAPVPEALAPYAAAVARFVPAWRRGPLVFNESSAVIGDSLLRLLSWCGTGHAAVLVIEDLHWADLDTLAVCEYLTAHVDGLPVVVVATWRIEEGPIASLRSLGDQRSIRLAPLSPAEIAEVAAGCLGQDPPEAILTRLTEVSNGLPLLVEDLLEHDAGTPARFGDLVAERLARLPAPAVPVIVAAALLGERFETPLLEASFGDGDARVPDALSDAMGVGMVVADGGSPRFRHALTHEAVLAAAPTIRSAVTPLVAAALERSGTARNIARAAQLQAGSGEADAAVRLFERSAALVDREGTPGAALALLDLARSLATDRPSQLRLDRARLAHLAALGRADEADELGNALLDVLGGQDERVVRLTLARAALDGGRPDRAAAHLNAVRGLASDDPVRLVLRAKLALQSGAGDRRVVAEHLAHQAIGVPAAGPATLCEALELAALCSRSRSLDDAAALLQQALAIAENARLTAWRLRTLNELGTVEMLQSADGTRLQRARDAARAAGALDVAAATAVNLAALHAMRGDLDATRISARAAHEEALRLGLRPVAAAALVMDALSYGFHGERDAMERRLRAAGQLSPSDADLDAFAWGAGRGICALVREERAEAVRAFSRAVQEDVPVGSLDTARGPLLLLREIAGEATEADVLAARATATPGAGWSDLWLGYAAAAASGRHSERDTAVATFDRADAAARRHPLFRAIGLRLVAEAALRDSWGDPVGWLRDAEGVFVGGGQLRIATACRDLLRQAGARTTRRRGADRGLPDRLLRAGVTAREAEVLVLVGERLSNKEIASRLYLSPRTVEKHVASLLLKLGAADRAALYQHAGDDVQPRMGA
jgi:DNA-binding CsgD family transcriptional regulator/tetratricopeptide (TPR) repeat protein